jgi:hypothetical protein
MGTAPPGATAADLPKVPCRWCRAKIEASRDPKTMQRNPKYRPRCSACGALQDATTIPTKNEEMPLISLFVNPDRSAFLEFVFKPPEEMRLDQSQVWRYTIRPDACKEFGQHPMGRKDPTFAEDEDEEHHDDQ